MRRRRERRPQEAAHNDRWLVSYADFITLLFAFFVVLYASAQMDNKKIVQVAAAIKGAFQELGVFTGSGSVVPPSRIVYIQGEGGSAKDFTPVRPCDASAPAGSAINGSSPAMDTMRVKKELETALGDDIKHHKVQMRIGPDGLVISLREIGFFSSGEAKLLPEAKPTLTRLAKVLDAENFEIRVEGHTDNVPIHNSLFNSNWELSTARATEVVTMLVREYGYDPRFVSVAGYGEYRPLYSNDTQEGRQANRRIDLVVLGTRKEPSPFAPSPAQAPAAAPAPSFGKAPR